MRNRLKIDRHFGGIDRYKVMRYSTILCKIRRISLSAASSDALDAVYWFDPDKEHKAHKSEVTKFTSASQAAQVETQKSVGLGTDCRMESRKLTGFSLTHKDEILHLSLFPRINGQGPNKRASWMERYTRRRQNRV